MKKAYYIFLVLLTFSCTTPNNTEVEELPNLKATVTDGEIVSSIEGSVTYSTLNNSTNFVIDLGCEDIRSCNAISFSVSNNFDEKAEFMQELGSESNLAFIAYSPLGVCSTTYFANSGSLNMRKLQNGEIEANFNVNLRTINYWSPAPQLGCEEGLTVISDVIKNVSLDGKFTASVE
ncbi:MAG: hypothetical protein ACMZ7B_03495 [Balneola sp.]